MDEKDQTQIRSSDSSAGQTRSRSRRQPADQSTSAQKAILPSQTAGSLANLEQNTQLVQTTGSLATPEQNTHILPMTDISAETTQSVPLEKTSRQTQSRAARQTTRPQPQPPQAILFSDREGETQLEEQILLPPVRRQRLRRTRRWLRSRSGRVVIPLLALLIGLAAGLTSVIWYGLSGEGSLVTIVPAAQGNLVVDANKDFVSQLVRNDIMNAGLPGHVQNVTVTLKHGAALVIQGDDAYPVVFLTVTKHFTVDIQPYVKSCILQVRITHADLSGIPVTTFVQTFQSKINQELSAKPAGLPGGFTYCTVGVSTEPGGMYITYQAVPVTH